MSCIILRSSIMYLPSSRKASCHIIWQRKCNIGRQRCKKFRTEEVLKQYQVGACCTNMQTHTYVQGILCFFFKRDSHAELCVLRIDPAVLELDGVIVTDRNAASHARFSPGSTGLSLIDLEQVFAEYWTHPGDELATDNHKKIKCAEVLVPSRIPPNYIVGAYISCVQSMRRLGEIAPQLSVTIDAHLFYQEQRQWFTH